VKIFFSQEKLSGQTTLRAPTRKSDGARTPFAPVVARSVQTRRRHVCQSNFPQLTPAVFCTATNISPANGPRTLWTTIDLWCNSQPYGNSSRENSSVTEGEMHKKYKLFIFRSNISDLSTFRKP